MDTNTLAEEEEDEYRKDSKAGLDLTRSSSTATSANPTSQQEKTRAKRNCMRRFCP